jgi:hypothetical protein
MILRPLVTLVLFAAAATGVFAQDSVPPDTRCLTEANGKQLLLLEYPEVELFARTETTRVYLAKRNGRLYRIELDACTTATISVQRVLPRR